MSDNKSVAIKPALPMTARGVSIDSMESLFRFADAVFQSGLAPTSLKNAQAIMIAIEMGLEVGLPPMAALQNIAVVNGRPTIWGDAQLGIVRSTGELEEFSEWYEINGTKTNRNPTQFTDDVTSVCRVKRFGFDAQECAFSVADAKRANLWGKAGPWTQYPARMLRYRSRSFALRDNFGDALRGLLTKEEVDDMDVANVTSVETVEPKPTGPRFKKSEPIIAQPVVLPVDQPTPSAPVDAPTAPAPVVTQPEPSEEPKQLPLQDQLSAHVTASGGTFDDFVTLCRNQNWVKPEVLDLWTGFADMPDTLAKKFLGAKRGVENGIKAILETKAQA